LTHPARSRPYSSRRHLTTYRPSIDTDHADYLYPGSSSPTHPTIQPRPARTATDLLMRLIGACPNLSGQIDYSSYVEPQPIEPERLSATMLPLSYPTDRHAYTSRNDPSYSGATPQDIIATVRDAPTTLSKPRRYLPTSHALSARARASHAVTIRLTGSQRYLPARLPINRSSRHVPTDTPIHKPYGSSRLPSYRPPRYLSYRLPELQRAKSSRYGVRIDA
jgi:hypothetical protein